MKLRHDRLILSLLLFCSVPFVCGRAIATEPVLWVQTQSIADLQGRPNLLPGQSKQVRKNQQTPVNILRRILNSYQKPNDLVDERNERLFRSSSLIAQTLSTQEAWQLLKQANEQIDNNNAQEAIKLLNIAKNIFEGDGDIYGESATLISLGTACMQLQSCDQTLNYYQRARMIVEEIKQHKYYYNLVTLINIGISDFYKDRKDYKQALKYYQTAILSANKIAGNDRYFRLNYINKKIGYIYNELDDYDSSISFFQKALEFARYVSREQEAYAHSDLAWAYNRKDKYAQALSQAQEALRIFKEENFLPGQAGTEDILGSIYDNLGAYGKAKQHYLDSLRIKGDLCLKDVSFCNPSGEATTRSNLGVLYLNINEYENARQTLAYAWKICAQTNVCEDEFKGKILSNLADAYYGLKEYKNAIEYAEQSIKIGGDEDPQGLARAFLQVGGFYETMGNQNQALEKYQKSLNIFISIKDRKGEASAFSKIGSLFISKKQSELAIVFLKKSISVYEIIRQDIHKLPTEDQKTYTNTIASTYRSLADLLLKQEGRMLEAQQILDLLKVQELDGYLQNVRGTEPIIEFRRAEQEILAKYNELQKSAIEISLELADLRKLDSKNTLTPTQQQSLTKLVKLETDINTQFIAFIDSPEIKTLTAKLQQSTANETINLTELRKLKDKLERLDAVLLYPLILDDRLELVLSIPGSPPLRRTVNVKREELNRTIAEFRSALGTRQSNTQELAERLYGWLIQPIEADLKQANPKTILYAPDGQLRYIPLAALYDGKQWLVERYRINNITALAFSDLVTQPRKDQQILAAAFGNNPVKVALDNQSFNFDGLPFTTKEVQSLAKTRPGTVSLFDRDFTLSTLQTRMNSFNILHLATHGKFLIGNPKKSFLVMGNGDRFSLSDIQESTLDNVDLVVLSACETGVGLTGKDEDGVEVLGIGYQFQRGGAKAAISSLWSINDGGTQKFMEIFYGLLQQGMPKAEALQQAQVALIKNDFTANGKLRGSFIIQSTGSTASIETNLKHPFYWAPFILIGNGL